MIYSRKCGENLTCKLDEEGVLIISGEAKMWGSLRAS